MDKQETVLNLVVLIATRYSEEEGCWYATCELYDYVRDGATECEAIAMCREAMEIGMESCFRKAAQRRRSEARRREREYAIDDLGPPLEETDDG